MTPDQLKDIASGTGPAGPADIAGSGRNGYHRRTCYFATLQCRDGWKARTGRLAWSWQRRGVVYFPIAAPSGWNAGEHMGFSMAPRPRSLRQQAWAYSRT